MRHSTTIQRTSCILGLLLMWATMLQAQEPWNDLKVYQINKMSPHTLVIPYSDAAGIDSLDYLHSDYCRVLNGTWKFFYCDNPAGVPNGFYGDDYDASQWASIKVPGNWELQGFGTPIYVNVKNEFTPNDPPTVPAEKDPVGCYVTDFELPTAWSGRNIILKFGAVKSAFYLYINGRQVGYSEDSKTPAEFDITKYVRQGRNRLALKVYRLCDGSYMEAQDFWRISGIERDVVLYSTPRVYIKDYKVTASLQEDDYETGRFGVDIYYSQELTAPRKIQIQLTSPKGDTLLDRTQTTETGDWYTYFIERNCQVGKVQPWSAERPYLYNLTIRLYDERDSLVELLGSKVGFRHLGMNEQHQLCINGRPILIKGVNRHEHSPLHGHYVTRDEMELDIQLMKQMNINAVRTCHYPDDEYWYELCNRYGIYVWDEANVETHPQGYGDRSLAKNPDWGEPMEYRINNMYMRDRNFPCVVAWSLGNECGNGVCTERTYRYLKNKDLSRPVTYERAETAYNTDAVEIMYPGVDYIADYARHPQTRPYIIAEYAHAMGNSMGGLSDYWDTIRRYPLLQGGFIWDWVDQSFPMTDSTGKFWYAVGGDLGSIPGVKDDDAFCANGIMGSNRIPHEGWEEVRHVYQGLHVACHVDTSHEEMSVRYSTLTGDPKGGSYTAIRREYTFILHNEYQFLNADEFDISYSVNGRRAVPLDPISLMPGDSCEIRLPDLHVSPMQRSYIRFYFKRRGGYESAADEFEYQPLSDDPFRPADKACTDVVKTWKNKTHTTIEGMTFSLKINNRNGQIDSYRLNGREILARPLHLNFWRPPTQNDLVDSRGAKAWSGLDRLGYTVTGLHTQFVDDTNRPSTAVEVGMMVEGSGPDGQKIHIRQIIEVSRDGALQLSYRIDPNGEFRTLPKIGVQFGLSADVPSVTWNGNQYPSYPDRRSAQHLGTHTATVDLLYDTYDPYVVPQEHGNLEAYWLRLADPAPITISGSGDEKISFSIRQYSDSLLTTATRLNQLKKDTFYTVSVDFRQAGLGTATCGPGVRDPYIVSGDSTYLFRLVIAPTALHDADRLGRLFGANPEIAQAASAKEPQRKLVRRITGSVSPASPYDKSFPQCLTDGRRAIVGDYHNGWTGYNGIDSLQYILELVEPVRLADIEIGFCQCANDWVMAPDKVDLQWSSDGVEYSKPVALNANTLQDPQNDCQRMRWMHLFARREARHAKYLKITVHSQGRLPSWHAYAGQNAWLMVDEISLHTK